MLLKRRLSLSSSVRTAGRTAQVVETHQPRAHTRGCPWILRWGCELCLKESQQLMLEDPEQKKQYALDCILEKLFEKVRRQSRRESGKGRS